MRCEGGGGGGGEYSARMRSAVSVGPALLVNK